MGRYDDEKKKLKEEALKRKEAAAENAASDPARMSTSSRYADEKTELKRRAVERNNPVTYERKVAPETTDGLSRLQQLAYRTANKVQGIGSRISGGKTEEITPKLRDRLTRTAVGIYGKYNEGILNLDTEKEERDLKKLDADLRIYDNFERAGKKDAMAEIDARYEGGLKKASQNLSIRQENLKKAKVAQYEAKNAGLGDPSSEYYDPEFEVLSQNNESEADKLYRYINSSAEEKLDQELREQFHDNNLVDTYSEKNYQNMSENEIAVFNYYYEKEGKAKAQQFLDSIQDDLNMRKGDMGAEAADSKYLQIMSQVLGGAEVAFDGYTQDLFDYLSGSETVRGTTAAEYRQQAIGRDMHEDGFVWGALNDLIGSTTNMLPQMVVGMFAGPTVGQATMFGQVSGKAYREAVNKGFDPGQAQLYATLVGASEVGLEKALGGIKAVGGNVLPERIAKWVNKSGKIESAIGRIALEYGARMGSEAFEEGLQEIIEPVISNLILGTDEKIDFGNAAYSALLGALTAGVFEGPRIAGSAIENYNTGKKILETEGATDSLVEMKGKVSADSLAYRLAGKVDKNTGAYDIGRLFYEMEGELTEANKRDISRFLVEKKHIDQKSAKTISDALAAVVDGSVLSKKQIDILNSNKDIGEAWKEAIINPNSTVNQRMIGYNEVRKALDSPKASPEASERSYEALLAEDDEIFKQNPNVAPERKYKADSDSKTVRNSDGSEVNIREVASVKDGKVTYRLDDGSTVDEGDLSLGSNDIIWSAMADMGVDATSANLMMDRYRIIGGVTPEVYASGIAEAYRYGQMNYPMTELAKGPFSGELSYEQASMAYRIGKMDAGRTIAKKIAIIQKNQQSGTVKKGQVHFEGNRDALTDRQKVSISALETVADSLGVQIYLFESKVDENERRVGANGWYDTKDGSIHIDIHAGANGEGTMLFTAAHELTHFIKQWSPAKFKVLANFLTQEYGQKGVSVEALVQRQIRKAKDSKDHSRELTYDEAFEEVIADSMETMLADGNVIEKLSKLKAQDKTLWEKIKSYITDLVSKIRGVYKGLTPDSREGRYVSEMLGAAEQLQNLFTEGLVEASENYQATPGVEGAVTNAEGDPVAFIQEDGTAMFSMRTYEEDGRTQFRNYLDKCVSSNRLTRAEADEMRDSLEAIYNACKEFKDKYAPFGKWSEAAVVEDANGKPVFSVVTPNGEYKMNLDFSLVCKKRRTLDAVFNEMAKRGIIDDFELGQKSVVKINEIIRRHGLETACALCFVDAKRFRQAGMADMFVELYNDLVYSLVPAIDRGKIAYFNFSGDQSKADVQGIHNMKTADLDFTHVNEVMKKYGKGTVEYKAAAYIKRSAEARKLLQRGDFMSSGGFDAVKVNNKTIMSLYNSKKGTGGPKAAFGDAQYLNEVIKKVRFWTPAKAYAVGGVRIQSFSDYMPRMVFDYVQMIHDLAAAKLPAHAYTKEAMFAKQFGLTGIKINMSLIPAVADGGIAPGLDAKGNYVWAGESFDFETAKQIQNAEGYTENCGTICVGVSRKHIEKLLSDPDIRMVIPYHKSGINQIVAKMNKIAAFEDYTERQNTRDADGKKISNDFDFNQELHAMGENADPKVVIQQYFDWCDERGYIPKFDEFRYHPNYYKLIEDFTLYDMNSRYVPQREVRAVFPTDDSAFGSMKSLIESALEEDAIVEGKRDSALGEIVDEIQQNLPRTEAEIEEVEVEQADRDLEADAKYSVREEFYAEVDAWDGKTDKTFRVGRTSEVLKSIGVKDSVVIWHSQKMRKIVEKHSGMDKEVIKQVPNILEKPVIILASKQSGSRLVMFGTVNDKNGVPVTVILELEPTTKGGQILDMNIIASAYGKDNTRGLVESSGLVYLDEDKKRTKSWLQGLGLQLSSDALALGSIGSVSYQGGKVNIESKPIDQYVKRDVEKKYKVDGGYVYTLSLVDNKTIKASPALGTPNTVPVQNAGNASSNRVPQTASNVKNQDRPTESVSNRSLLANALEGVTKNDIEKKRLQEYKDKISVMDAEDARLRELRSQIKEMSFAKGPRDKEKLRGLRDEATKIANRISIYDKQLLRLEASAPLQNILTREKKKAADKEKAKADQAMEKYKKDVAQKQHEMIQRNQESRKRATENRHRTEMRHKIKNVVNELNQYLLHGTKEKHVPIQLQKAVASALDAVNMDTVGAEARIAKLREEMLRSKNPEKIQEISRTIDRIAQMGDRMNDRLQALKDAYDKITESDDPIIANSYDEVISNKLESVISTIGDTPLRDMTMQQMEEVYDMYKMVLAKVRGANKAFAEGKTRDISIIAGTAMMELDRMKRKNKASSNIRRSASSFSWNNLKPVYAFERIGSSTLVNLFKNVRTGEDTWATDMSDAKDFHVEKAKKYGYDSWDLNTRYEFESTSGLKFDLNIEQIMALYAYSKRGDQAIDHLKHGGFVHDPQAEVRQKKLKFFEVKKYLDDATAYNISDETLAKIIGTLNENQRGFVDDMQAYLSDVMGAKGNEVSLAMYEVKLFNEKYYFPLKSAPQYMEKAREAEQGEVKIKNKGFTKQTAPKAKNPIVLSSFMDVWADHVNEMSLYHAFTLPLEDFYRVYNYRTPSNNPNLPTEGVNPYIINAHGKAATQYIEQLLKDINGGAIADSRESVAKNLMSKFKKAEVFSSLSVVIQQPSAIARAWAYLNPLYFKPTRDGMNHKELWAEVKKYAPVAAIKEMGYFDTGMGRSARDFLKDTGYEGFWNKAKAFVTDGSYRDELLSIAPALADELTWCAIWNATKREVIHKNHHLSPKSEEFLKLVGERFTEVVTKTQVYDSVMARSAHMRSKSAFMNMWTSFMAEPTTSINMIEDALRNGKKGFAVRALASVASSVILNSALVSLVYAARDDDEEETFWEKYLSSLTSELVDGFNPLTYYPGIKDLWSALQGFDIERADMSLVTKLFDSVQQWVKVVAKDTDDMDEDELAKYKEELNEAVWSVVDNISSLARLPVKNIRREFNAAQNLFKVLGSPAKTTKESLKNSVTESVKNTIPILGWLPDETKADKMFNAVMDGDKEYINRLRGEYKTEESFRGALKGVLKKRHNGGLVSDSEAKKVLMSYCELDAEEAEDKIGEWKFGKQYPGAMITYSQYKKWEDNGKDAGVSMELFTEVAEYRDNDGADSRRGQEEVARYINSLKVERRVKDALWCCFWSETTLENAPWR